MATRIGSSGRREVGEIAAAIATGSAFVAAMTILRAEKIVVIIVIMASWIPYVAWRVRRERGIAHAWGVRLDNLRAAAGVPVVFAVVTALAISIDAMRRGLPRLPWLSLLVFASYPIWALFQQFFVQAMIARNLQRLGARLAVNVLVTAVLFGLVHLPDPSLAGLCFVAGLVWTWSYLKTPNLLVLAVCHGWLGAIVYYALLRRDPLAG